jgi:hypothetical protein
MPPIPRPPRSLLPRPKPPKPLSIPSQPYTIPQPYAMSPPFAPLPPPYAMPPYATPQLNPNPPVTGTMQPFSLPAVNTNAMAPPPRSGAPGRLRPLGPEEMRKAVEAEIERVRQRQNPSSEMPPACPRQRHGGCTLQ